MWECKEISISSFVEVVKALDKPFGLCESQKCGLYVFVCFWWRVWVSEFSMLLLLSVWYTWCPYLPNGFISILPFIALAKLHHTCNPPIWNGLHVASPFSYKVTSSLLQISTLQVIPSPQALLQPAEKKPNNSVFSFANSRSHTSNFIFITGDPNIVVTLLIRLVTDLRLWNFNS